MEKEQLLRKMAAAYHEYLNAVVPLFAKNRDIEFGAKEGLDKFLSNLYIRYNGKNTDFCSDAAKSLIRQGKRSGKLVFEHMIPKNRYQKLILTSAENNDPLTEKEIFDLLKKYWWTATITAEEHRLLDAAGFGSEMPEGWDGKNIFYRYQKVGISLAEM